MASSKISPPRVCHRLLPPFTALVIAGAVACEGSAVVRGEAEAPPPAPGLVVVEPGLYAVGDADAPEAYYSEGYYWRSDEDRWYRRPDPDHPWVIVETRVVPERVVVHERQQHAAIVARRPPPPPREEAVRPQALAPQDARPNDQAEEQHEQAVEAHKEADAERAAERSRESNEAAVQRKEARERKDAQRRGDAERAAERSRESNEAAVRRKEAEGR